MTRRGSVERVRLRSQMRNYESLAPFYDPVQGDRAEPAAYVRGLIERHHPSARSVLELACGTGSILKQLQENYRVAGVDISQPMLDIAAKKLPRAQLFHCDMTEVSLGRTFDIVLCIYEAINHLLTFEQWESVFDRADEHLAKGGIFICDIGTKRRLRELVEQPAVMNWFDDRNLFMFDVTEAEAEGVVTWDVRVFEHLENDSYRLHSELLDQIAFDVEQIKTALQKRFKRVRIYDRRRARPSTRSARLHFVCAR